MRFTTLLAQSDGELQEVVVSAHYKFLSVDTSGTTNLPVPIEQVPQSISLVSEDFIKAADLKTLGEIAEYTPGALNVGNQEGFQTLVKLRGFVVTPALDGINQIVSYYEPDYAIFDRVEMVKGPSSVVYGVSKPGWHFRHEGGAPGDSTQAQMKMSAVSRTQLRLLLTTAAEPGLSGDRSR